MFTNDQEIQYKVYKVSYEHLETNEVSSMLVQAVNASEAGFKALGRLGEGYDLLKTVPAKKSELQ